MASKVIFLDRDGTINVDHGYVYKVSDWQLIEKVPEALLLLQKAGFILTIITNQSAIAQGKYTEADMQVLHAHMEQQLAAWGVTFRVIAFCPHARNQNVCDCRKPKIGMARQIEQVVGEIDYSQSWTVGDKEMDVLFGKTAGTKTALIRSGYWNADELSWQPDVLADSLYDFAQQILPIT